MKTTIKNIILGLLILSSTVAMAVEFPQWDVPASANEKNNPIEKDKFVIEEGASLYKMQCAACHGPKGKGDGALPAADLTTPKFLEQTDGAILHKLQEGRGAMPSFKSIDENSLWKVIHFLRDLSEVKADVPKRDAKLSIDLYHNEGGINKVIAKVNEQLADGKIVPASAIKVGLYVKRYFGLLPIGKGNLYSNEKGIILSDFPTDIPGDGEGEITIIAKVEDSEFNPIEVSQTAVWGTPKPASNWENERALWKTNEYVPWWVLLSFLGITIGIWIGIIKVMLMIKKIRDIGNIVS